MGLRALCCSSGDLSDNEGQSTARPSQAHPEDETQKPSSNVVKTPSLAERPSNEKPSPPRDLWKEAYDGLDKTSQKYVPATGMTATEAIQGVIDSTTTKYEEWEKGGLRIHHKGGNDTNLRDWSENILGAAMKAKIIVSTAVSFDPTGHASSAWTVISFGMSIVQNRLDRRDAIFASSEYLTEKLAYFALIDVEYRNQGVGSDKPVDDALLRVYSAILKFSSEVKKDQEENEAVSIWHSIFPLTDQALSLLKTTLEAESENARKWTNLASNLGDRKQAKEHLALSMSNIKSTRNIETKITTAEDEKQLIWISDFDFSLRHRELQGKRTEETGIWLLNSQEYNEWKQTPGSLLWLGAISGCGKSVLCSNIIDDLKEISRLDPHKFVAYWYFQFDKGFTKSVDALARSLIRQLSRSPLLSSVTDLWDEHGMAGSQPSFKQILAVLHDVLTRTEHDIYIVLDALDECPQNPEQREREVLLSLVTSLVQQHSDKVHILTTSRRENDITKKLGKFSMVDLEGRLVEDVKEFVTKAISREPLERYDESVKKLIFDTLLSSKERRFRWAELQIKELERKRSAGDVKESLKKLPRSLEETYRLVLDGIAPDDVPRAADILMLICMSYATLDATLVAQMTEIWAEDIVSICTTSLVNVFDDQVQLAHFSVQEFLVLSEEDSKVEHHECQFTVIQGHRRLAEKSIDCLLAKTEPLLGADAMKMPWFLYASKHWHVHLGSAGGLDELDSDLQDKVTRLFLESTVYFNWIRGAESQPDNDEWSKVFVECEPPIHRAVALGFGHTIKDLIAQTQYADWRKVWDETDSLSMAAGQGHLDILQDLLEQNLSLDRKVAKSILKNIDHRKAGPDKLCKILETLWRQGLLGATDANDTLDEDVVLSAMQSEWSAVETLATFLSWRPQVTFPLTDNVIIIGMLWSKSPKGIVKLFLEKCHFRVPQAALARTTDRTIVYSTEALSFLALERPKELPINDSLLTVLAWEGDSAGMRSLLQAQKEKCRIPQFVFEYATENEDEAGMVPLLWEYREPDVKVDHSMLMNASSKRSHACETTKFLIERLDPDFSLDETVVLDIIRFSKDGVAMLRMLRSLPNVEVKVSENLVEEVCAHRDALAMLRVLETEEELGLPITESIVLAAAENSADACSVLGYLAQLCHDRLPITEEALIKAVDDPSQGDRALGALMKDTPDTMVTDYVFTSACKNKDAMRMLLDKHPEKAPVDRIVDTIVFHGGSAAGTLQLILERNMLDVDDALIEILATSFNLMNTLLLCKPDIAIPEKCLIESMIDPRTVRLIIAHQGSPFIVTEDLLIAAAKSLNGVESLEVLLNRQNSVPVTDRVIRTVCRMGAVKELHWLLNQKSESYFKEYWHEVWTSPDYGMGLKVSLLGYFMQRTNSTITDSMLSDLPCDPTQPDENLLETLLNPFCPTEGENDDSGDEEDSYELKVAKAILPQTERTAEIVVERCRQRAVQGFLQSTKIPITDNVLQAVERNCVTDRDELRTALKEMRD